MNIMPLLNAAKLLPPDLIVKGLEKINPKFKNFFTTAASYGYGANRAIDYLVDRFTNPGQKQFQEQLDKGAAEGTLRPDEGVARGQMASHALPGQLARGAISLGGAGILGAIGSESSEPQQQQEAGDFQNVIAQFSPELASILDKAYAAGHTIDEMVGIATSPNYKFQPVIGHMEGQLGVPFYDIIRQTYGGPKQGQRQRSGPVGGNKPPQGQQAASRQEQSGDDALLAALEKVLKM